MTTARLLDPNENCPRLATRIFFLTTSILSIIFNLIFLRLIQRHTSSALKPYKIVLIFSAVADIITGLLLSLIMVVGFFQRFDIFNPKDT